MRLWIATFSLLLLTAASAPKYKGVWVSVLDTDAIAAVSVDKGKYKKIGRVVPARLFKLTDASAVTDFVIGYLGAGTLMVPVDNSLRKFCRLERHAASAFGCLTDTDGDGRLDTYFGTQVFKEFFTGSVGDDGGHQRLLNQVSIVEINAAESAPQIDLEFHYLGKNNRNSVVYQFCLSKRIMDNVKFFQSPSRKGFSVICTEKLRASGIDGNRLQGFGVEMKILSSYGKAMTANIQRPLEKTFETVSGFN